MILFINHTSIKVKLNQLINKKDHKGAHASLLPGPQLTGAFSALLYSLYHLQSE